VKKKGEVLIITLRCPRGHTEKICNVARWEERKRTGGKRGFPIECFNMEMVAAQLLDGGTYEVYCQRCHERGLPALSKNSYR
jgi:hypothetical protein